MLKYLKIVYFLARRIYYSMKWKLAVIKEGTTLKENHLSLQSILFNKKYKEITFI